MITDRPLSPYSALFTELLFWDSWKVTFERKKRSALKVGSSDLQMDPPWQRCYFPKRGVSLTSPPVFRIEAWDLEGAETSVGPHSCVIPGSGRRPSE